MYGVLSNLSPEAYLTLQDNLEFLIRILVATILGIIVGVERAIRLKGAGVRTHCIIAMTAAVFMILSKYAFIDLSLNGERGADPGRIVAQVVSGISFLGAGIIFKQGKNTVKGLTTAAGMWATAAIGMSIGAGLYWIGIAETIILILLQNVFHFFKIGADMLTEQYIRVVMENDKKIRKEFQNLLESHQCIIENTSIVRDGTHIEIEVNVRSSYPITYDQGVRFMRDNPEVKEFNIEAM